MVSFCRKSTSIRFARNTVSALPADVGPDSYAKLATLAKPTTSPAAVPPDTVASSLKDIVSYKRGASNKLFINTKLPKSDVTVLFISLSNVLGLSTSLYVAAILSVL